MQSNAFFTIGKSHIVCEDYARAGIVNDRAYAALSDGCSSSKDTDVGARLLVGNAVRALRRNLFKIEEIGEVAVGHARDNIACPDIDSTCLDATLLIATELLANRSVLVAAFGDGFIIARRHDGVIESYQIDYGAYPAYPMYSLSEARRKVYLENNPNGREICSREIVDGVTTRESFSRSVFVPTTTEDLHQTFSTWACFCVELPQEKYDLVILASDGLGSFIDKDGHPVPVSQIIKEVADIKTFSGEFMVRRGKAVTGKVCAANGWQHYDDLALAAIYIGGKPK